MASDRSELQRGERGTPGYGGEGGVSVIPRLSQCLPPAVHCLVPEDDPTIGGSATIADTRIRIVRARCPTRKPDSLPFAMGDRNRPGSKLPLRVTSDYTNIL